MTTDITETREAHLLRIIDRHRERERTAQERLDRAVSVLRVVRATRLLCTCDECVRGIDAILKENEQP